MTILGLYIPVG